MTVRQRLHPEFQDDLTHLINKHNWDSLTDTEDFILAGMLTEFMESYRKARMWQKVGQRR